MKVGIGCHLRNYNHKGQTKEGNELHGSLDFSFLVYQVFFYFYKYCLEKKKGGRILFIFYFKRQAYYFTERYSNGIWWKYFKVIYLYLVWSPTNKDSAFGNIGSKILKRGGLIYLLI